METISVSEVFGKIHPDVLVGIAESYLCSSVDIRDVFIWHSHSIKNFGVK